MPIHKPSAMELSVLAAHAATIDSLAEIRTATSTRLSTTAVATTVFDVLQYFGDGSFTQQELAEAPPIIEERRSPAWSATAHVIGKLHATDYLADAPPRPGSTSNAGFYKANPSLERIAHAYNGLYGGTVAEYELEINDRKARGMVALALDLPNIDSIKNMSEAAGVHLAVVRNLYFTLGAGALRCLGRIDASINRMVNYRIQQRIGLIPAAENDP